MGIYVKQWAVATFTVDHDGKILGTQRVPGLPLMTRAEAEKAVANSKGEFVVINTLSE